MNHLSLVVSLAQMPSPSRMTAEWSPRTAIPFFLLDCGTIPGDKAVGAEVRRHPRNQLEPILTAHKAPLEGYNGCS